jgi:hypothetical protein
MKIKILKYIKKYLICSKEGKKEEEKGTLNRWDKIKQ